MYSMTILSNTAVSTHSEDRSYGCKLNVLTTYFVSLTIHIVNYLQYIQYINTVANYFILKTGF